MYFSLISRAWSAQIFHMGLGWGGGGKTITDFSSYLLRFFPSESLFLFSIDRSLLLTATAGRDLARLASSSLKLSQKPHLFFSKVKSSISSLATSTQTTNRWTDPLTGCCLKGQVTLPRSLLLPAESHFFLRSTLTLSERLSELIQATNQETKLATFLLGL